MRSAPNSLVLVPSDSDEDIFVAVRVKRTNPCACVLGWLRGSEGKLPQFHQKNCWVIPPEALHDIEKLPGKEWLRAMPPYGRTPSRSEELHFLPSIVVLSRCVGQTASAHISDICDV